MTKALVIDHGSVAKWTIYSYRAHNATSFVHAVSVSGQEVLEEIWIFQEIELVIQE
jgi:hypothetical protein